MDRDALLRALLPHLASRTLDAAAVTPVLRKWSSEESAPLSIVALIDALRDETDPDLQRLVSHLQDVARGTALRHHQLKKAGSPVPVEVTSVLAGLPLDAPLGWASAGHVLHGIRSALSLLGHGCFLGARRERCPETTRVVERAFLEAARAASRSATPGLDYRLRLVKALEAQAGDSSTAWTDTLRRMRDELEARRRDDALKAEDALRTLPAPVPADLDETVVFESIQARFQAATTREEKARLLDLACAWPSERVIPLLLSLVREPWAQDRASLILSLRFADSIVTSWGGWERWLGNRVRDGQDPLEALGRERPGETLLCLYAGGASPDPETLARLGEWCGTHGEVPSASRFLETWADAIPAEEWQILQGEVPGPKAAAPPPMAPVPVPAPPPAEPAVAGGTPEAAAAPPEPAPPPPPPVPSLWESHVRPFFIENWYMVAGVIMVVVGSSLLAFYTWDKHWLIRYTVMPALLGGFTGTLAWVGSWIERRDAQFKGTAATMRGTAIGLLPVNFMALALLSNDPQVTQKELAVPLMGSLYVLLFGWGLKRWCSAVHASLGWLLGGTLLVLNGLVAVSPLARVLSPISGQDLLHVLGAGFYAGFLALAASVVIFSRRILTRELADEKRVPWFFGTTLVVTYLQVFAWVHGSLRHLPQTHTYGPMVILAGWLVLLVERRTLELRETTREHGVESFLGFALILLGSLLGATEPVVRVLSFVLAGGVWLYQAIPRRHPVHHWIGLTFVMLGAASVGLLEGFPGPWYPALGVGTALGFGILAVLFSRAGQADVGRAAIGMQTVALLLTAATAVLTQWHYRSAPSATAACLVLVAILFAWRAWRDGRLPWVHTALVVLALALPYLGCVDLESRSLRGNTMAFGLSVISFLWLGLTRVRPAPLLLAARSTVLTLYGALALSAMFMRVLLERQAGAEGLSPHAVLDFSGPVLMTVALIFATWHSRSLIPAVIAVLIAAILFPEAKAYLQLHFKQLHWGSGLGSSLSAVGLVLACFWLRRRPSLGRLEGGDPFPGTGAFPLRRPDFTLFTWPLMASALFLILKVELWKLPQHLLGGGVRLNTATALALTGAAWTLMGVYHRSIRGAVLGTHLGWIWLLVGIAFGYKRLVEEPTWTTPILVFGLVQQGLYLLYRFALEPRHAWVGGLLSAPTRSVLAVGSLLVSIVCTLALIFGAPLDRLALLMAFVAAQLVWHGLSSRTWIYGICLVPLTLTTLLAWTAPGEWPLLVRLSLDRSLDPVLWMILAIEALHLALERGPGLHDRLKPIAAPFHMISALLGLGLGIAGAHHALESSGFALGQQILLLAGILLAARAQGAGSLALLGVFLAYLLAHRGGLGAVETVTDRVRLLTMPWRCGLLALVMAALGHAGRWIHARHPALLQGPFPLLKIPRPSGLWIHVPAAVLAVLAACYQTADPAMREASAQLGASYLGAAALALVTWSRGWSRVAGYGLSLGLLALGNVHAVRVFLGDALRSRGLSENHLFCLGLVATLLAVTLWRLAARRETVTVFMNRASLILAALILIILSVNYFVQPDLGAITPLRFAVSGAMAYLAGLYFRRAARRPGRGEEPYGALCEGFYHVGVTMALWCAALLVPWLRKPDTALIALGLPVLYFYVRTEAAHRLGRETTPRYRNSATTLGFVVLGLYVFRGVFQMVIFPEIPVWTDHYHVYSPLAMILGLVMLRLRGLGGIEWLAVYGGLALMGGSFFALTALPGLSPFDHPMPAAWCAVVIGHFWTLASTQRSPLRTAIQRMGAIDGSGWNALRRAWGICLTVACQGVVLLGILDYASDTRGVAPLLLGASSLLIHHGVIRGSRVYHIVAGLEIAMALHADFVIPSTLPKEQVVWALVGIWALALVSHAVLSRFREAPRMGPFAALLAAAVLAHVFYHHPGSAEGLWAFAAGALLGAWTPREDRAARTGEELLAAAALPWVPTWLVFFSQTPLREEGPLALLKAWPILASAATLFATGAAALAFQRWLFAPYSEALRPRPRLFDQTAAWLGRSATGIYTATLWTAFLVTAAAQVLHYGTALDPREMALIVVLYATLGAGWLVEGRARRAIAPYAAMLLCALGLFAAVRRQILLTQDFWRYEYDVWAGLAAALCLAGTKQVWDRQPREVRIPLLGALLAVPAATLLWVAWRDLGTDTALMVVGLHSVLFMYMGKDERESPWNIAATAGFVAFVFVLFWSRLSLRVVYAYVVPVGIGILVLLQLFGGRIPSETRNRIRLVTLLAMLGSAGYYALIDDRYPVAFNMSLVVICLLSMGLGGFLRIRMYMALGFAGLMVALVSILYKVLAHMERNARMTVVGSLVLVIGALLVFGAIYYKTHREEWTARLDRWRKRFGDWE